MTLMRKTITISYAMEEWIKSQIKSGRYGNDSEYFRDLIRRDQDKKRAEVKLLSLIEEGLNSGVSSKNAEDVRFENKVAALKDRAYKAKQSLRAL